MAAAEFPTHAVVRLRGSDDMCALLKLLVEHGYADVAFMSGPPDAMRRKPTANQAVQTDVPVPHSAPPPPAPPPALFPTQTVMVGGLPVAIPDLAQIQSFASIHQKQQGTMQPPTVSLSLATVPNVDIQVNKVRTSTSSLGSKAASPDSDSSDTIRCQLCSNPIKTNRHSNMLNHVRRHAPLKQFKCVYCEYQHNETAKVRLHMLHNHDDHDSTPEDKWSPQLQTMWDQLMAECFPKRSTWAHSSRHSLSINEEAAVSPDSSDVLETTKYDDSGEPDAKMVKRDGTSEPGNPDSPEVKGHEFEEETAEAEAGVKVDNSFVDMAEPLDAGSMSIDFLEEAAAMEITQQQLGGGRSANFLHSISADSRRYSPRCSIQGYNSSANPVMLTCQLCSRTIVSHPRQALMSHAKRHCSRKQWKCIQCPYSSSETAHVRNHMASKHELVDVTPMDTRNPALEEAWHIMFSRCFPSASQPPHRLRSRVFDTGDGEE